MPLQDSSTLLREAMIPFLVEMYQSTAIRAITTTTISAISAPLIGKSPSLKSVPRASYSQKSILTTGRQAGEVAGRSRRGR